ncbi:SWF or SNF family helicase [Streptomyces sp. NPDC058417]|uniref:SWF or SNF family helicase n=1 Tax=Streptomyces sp. NPDC058417 TaxID=3346487 RepID=UPI00364B621E
MNGHDDSHGDGAAVGAEELTFAVSPVARGTVFARSWWGRAWLAALENGALDGEQIRSGRRLARAGGVGAVSVRPGRVTAVVQDADGTAVRSDVLLGVLTDAQWNHFLDLAVERVGHVAALLDREMPLDLVEDAEAAGVDLLPGLGELEAECGCDAWDHCGHTAALCYQVARLLDEDPFVLLLLRGRSERGLVEELQTRGTAVAFAEGPAEQEGQDAAEAWRREAARAALPAVPPPPERPGVPPSLDTGTVPPAGVDTDALELLASAAAARAHALLAWATGPASGRQERVRALAPAEDAVRLAAHAVQSPRRGVRGPTSDTRAPQKAGGASVRGRAASAREERAIQDRLAAGAGRSREQLALAVRAWLTGGADALAVLEEEWTVEGEALSRARAALDAAWDEGERPELRVRANRWTVGGGEVQLRLGRDAYWWPYLKERGRWVPAGDAARDPAVALVSAESARQEALSAAPGQPGEGMGPV